MVGLRGPRDDRTCSPPPGDRIGGRPTYARRTRTPARTTRNEMDQITKDARRLASIGTFFIVAGWVFVIYALIGGVLWWIDLAQREAFNIITSLAISASAVGLPIFAAFLIAGLGYAMRLYALDVASRSGSRSA